MKAMLAKTKVKANEVVCLVDPATTDIYVTDSTPARIYRYHPSQRRGRIWLKTQRVDQTTRNQACFINTKYAFHLHYNIHETCGIRHFSNN